MISMQAKKHLLLGCRQLEHTKQHVAYKLLAYLGTNKNNKWFKHMHSKDLSLQSKDRKLQT